MLDFEGHVKEALKTLKAIPALTIITIIKEHQEINYPTKSFGIIFKMEIT